MFLADSGEAGVLGAVSVLVRTVQFEIADASSIDRGELTSEEYY